jgi:hypothetical protein
MNAGAGQGVTIKQVLNEEAGDEALEGALREGDVAGAVDRRLAPVPPGLRAFARDEIVAVAVGALEEPLVDVLTAGWRRWDELTDAARRSLQVPGSTELVELHDERITSTHRPRIDVMLDRVEVAHVDLEFVVDVVLHGVTAVVRGGRLSALRTGRADVTARLSVEGVPVTESTRTVDLTVEIGLRGGIALLDGPHVIVLPPSPTDEPTIPR